MNLVMITPGNPQQQKAITSLADETIVGASFRNWSIYTAPEELCVSMGYNISRILSLGPPILENRLSRNIHYVGQGRRNEHNSIYFERLKNFIAMQEKQRIQSLMVVIDTAYLAIFPHEEQKTFGGGRYMVINTDNIGR